MKIEVNSLDAVCLFALYICLQDEEISDLELKGLLQDIPVLKDLYFQLYGEYSSLHLDEIAVKVHQLFESNNTFATKVATNKEVSYFDNLLSDKKLKDVALLVANSAASKDGLHDLERKKINFWIQRWT